MSRSFLPLAVLALAACGPSITITRDGAVPMPGAATYVWGHPPKNVPNAQGVVEQSPVIQQRIKTAIDAELRAKGYRLTDSSQAAFIVRFAVGSRFEQTQVNQQASTGSTMGASNVCGGASCWSGWDWGFDDVQVSDAQTKKSGVVVDLLDRRSGTVAWRGIYAHEATGKVPSQQAVTKAAQKLFAKLPAAM